MVKRSLLELKKVGVNAGFIFTQSSNFELEESWNSLGWVVIPDTAYSNKEV